MSDEERIIPIVPIEDRPRAYGAAPSLMISYAHKDEKWVVPRIKRLNRDYGYDFSDITDCTFPPQTAAQPGATTPQETITEDAKTTTPAMNFAAHILAFADETNIAPEIMQNLNFDEVQSLWAHIQTDYPNSVKHWREHHDLLAHAFAGVPFAEVSAELVSRVRFGQRRDSYSKVYLPTVNKHLAKLQAAGLR